jgi:hypothetical protein
MHLNKLETQPSSLNKHYNIIIIYNNTAIPTIFHTLPKVLDFLSAVGIRVVTGYGLDDQEVRVLSPGRVKILLLSTSSRLVLGPTQPPNQCVLGDLSQGVKLLGVKLTIHLHLVPMSRRHGSIHPLSHMFPWHSV